MNAQPTLLVSRTFEYIKHQNYYICFKVINHASKQNGLFLLCTTSVNKTDINIEP